MPFKPCRQYPALYSPQARSLKTGASEAEEASLFKAEINGKAWRAAAVALLEPELTGANYYTLVGGTFASGRAPATVLTLSLASFAQPGLYRLVSPALATGSGLTPSAASGWYIHDLQCRPAVFDLACGVVRLTEPEGGNIRGSFECLAIPQNDPAHRLIIKKGRFVIAPGSY